MTGPTALDRASSGGLAGTAALVLAMDVDPAIEEQFNAWYTHEHLHDRVGLPGFNRGTRWIRDEGSAPRQKYLTIYEADSTDAFTSAEYLRSLDNPTPWTRQMVAAFQNSLRTVVTVTASAGAVTARELSVLEFTATDPAGLADWFGRVAVPQALSDPDGCGLHLLTPDLAATGAKATTTEGRGVNDQVAQQLIVLHGTRRTADLLRTLLRSWPESASAPDAEIATYSFYCALAG